MSQRAMIILPDYWCHIQPVVCSTLWDHFSFMWRAQQSIIFSILVGGCEQRAKFDWFGMGLSLCGFINDWFGFSKAETVTIVVCVELKRELGDSSLQSDRSRGQECSSQVPSDCFTYCRLDCTILPLHVYPNVTSQTDEIHFALSAV